MNGLRLLVLDDDRHVGRMVQLIAESVGFTAHFVTSAVEFFQFLNDWQPTHIVVDLVMPDMGGLEVLQHVASGRLTPAVIISSGVGTRSLEVARLAASARGLKILGTLTKPFSPKTLRTMLTGAPPSGGNRTAIRPDERPTSARPTAVAPGTPTVAELQRALLNRELRLVYQPQVHCATGAIAGFEALVRWDHPSRGALMPDRFIAMAQGAGMIDAVTEYVLREAVAWHRSRFSKGVSTLSVKLSARSISSNVESPATSAAGNSSFVEKVAVLLGDSPKPGDVLLEFTESSAMANPDASLDLMTQLRSRGFQLSLDEFGTGYSSMLQLVRLPFCEIKIDRSFVMTALRSAESRAVVESSIRLGHSLGLRVVAEGVEDSETLHFLRAADCDLAQGLFIARPMPGDAADAWAAESVSSDLNGSWQRPSP